MKALLDSNVAIDFLNGVEAARKEVRRYDDAAISIVTWVEVMVGVPKEDEEETLAFLSRLSLIPLTMPVAERAVELRRKRRIKLPDAIIWASAQIEQRLLVTRNTKDFPGGDPGIRIPYKI